ncbi:MAG: hypothetical protein SH850_11810 [Planctomycetaceae bacterium]|nr:hypothetical protein [Planctomycetaceae bacterium]
MLLLAAANSDLDWNHIANPAIGTLLAAAIGGFLGYFWVVSLGTERHGLATVYGRVHIGSLLGLGGILLLNQWSVAVGPLAGCGYFFGLAVAIARKVSSNVRDFTASAHDLSESERKELASYVWTQIFYKSESEIHALVKAKTSEMREGQSPKDAMNRLHLFIHATRDQAVRYVDAHRRIWTDFVEGKHNGTQMTVDSLQKEITGAFRDHLGHTLGEVKTLFESLTGRRGKIWVAVREFHRDGKTRGFRTLLRVGDQKMNEQRQGRSVSIPEDQGLPHFLKRQYETGNGIVRLGAKKLDRWVHTKNDDLKQDCSVMAGPIIMKSWSEKEGRERRELYMILYVNSPVENVFCEHHEDYLRCCTDALSLFFSLVNQMMADMGCSSLFLQESSKID